jgi:orotate phosphoribosyltransferase
MRMSMDVAQALVRIGGVGFSAAAPITFKSGLLSPVYCDNRRFPFHPAEWARVIAAFERVIAQDAIGVEVIGGIEAAGIPHSAALGFAMKLPSIFIRKEAKGYGAKKRVEGGDVAGKRVVLVEDLVTTGSSSLSAVEALRSEGAIVSDCLAILQYGFVEAQENFARAGVTLHATTTFDEVLEAATQAGRLSSGDAETVRDWLHDAPGWAARHGFAEVRA